MIRLVKWYKGLGFKMVGYEKCGDYIANAKMELELPSILVLASTNDKGGEKNV